MRRADRDEELDSYAALDAESQREDGGDADMVCIEAGAVMTESYLCSALHARQGAWSIRIRRHDSEIPRSDAVCETSFSFDKASSTALGQNSGG